jgi:hemerythrin superfamily protein
MAKPATRTQARTASRRKKASKTPATRRKTATRTKSVGRTKAAGRRKTGARSTTARRTTASVPAAIRHAAQEMTTGLAVAEMPTDAVALLQRDHRTVEALFEEFEHTQGKADKAALAAKICLELRVHTQIEEELLYPPAHRKLEHDLVDEAIVEHASAKELIGQIETMNPGEHLYDAKVKVLSEYVKHHVKEEETEMFPKLRGRGMNLQDLAERLYKRKVALIRGYAKAG